MCRCSMASLWLTVFSFLVRGCVRPLVKNPRTGHISGAKAWFMLIIAKGLLSFISHNHIFTFYQNKGGKYELTGGWPYCYPLWPPYRSFYPNSTEFSCYVLQSYAHNFLCRIVFLVLSAHYSTGFDYCLNPPSFGIFTPCLSI